MRAQQNQIIFLFLFFVTSLSAFVDKADCECIAGPKRPFSCIVIQGLDACNHVQGCEFSTIAGAACLGQIVSCTTHTNETSCINDLWCDWIIPACSSSHDCPNGGCCNWYMDGTSKCLPPKCQSNFDCQKGFRCVGTRCDAHCKSIFLPEGIFDYKKGPLCYSNGKGHYCCYPDMEHFKCLTGKSNVPEGTPVYDVDADWKDMIYDGACLCQRLPEGIFDYKNGPLCYSNGEGHYCCYKSMEHFKCLTGESKVPNGTPVYDVDANWKDMIYDGACFSEACQ